MAVGTQQPQIFQAIVAPVSVDVVDFQRDRAFQPFRQSTRQAAVFKNPFSDEPFTQVIGADVGRIFD